MPPPTRRRWPEELVVCSGGPRDRAWYTAADWQQNVECARLDGETPMTGRTLGYVVTDGYDTHPTDPRHSGRVLRWNPELAASREPAAPTAAPPPR